MAVLDLRITVNAKAITDTNIRGAFARAVRRTAIETTSAIKASRTVPVNLGTLRNSITSRRVTDLDYLISSPLKYAIVMEQGRKPGRRMPPSKPIEAWILQKGIFKQAARVRDFLNRKAVAAGLKGAKKTKLAGFAARSRGGFAGKLRRGRARKSADVSAANALLKSLSWKIRRKIAIEGSPEGREGQGFRFFRIASRKVNARLRRNMALEIAKL